MYVIPYNVHHNIRVYMCMYVFCWDVGNNDALWWISVGCLVFNRKNGENKMILLTNEGVFQMG